MYTSVGSKVIVSLYISGVKGHSISVHQWGHTYKISKHSYIMSNQRSCDLCTNTFMVGSKVIVSLYISGVTFIRSLSTHILCQIKGHVICVQIHLWGVKGHSISVSLYISGVTFIRSLNTHILC